jgi:surface antigen
MAVAVMAGPALTAPAQAAVGVTAHVIPGGVMPASSGVKTLCYDETGFSCAGAGYNGTSSQVGGHGWAATQYWSYGSAGPGGARHNCTTYVAYRLRQDGMKYPGWTGNADQWAAGAAGHGTAVDQVPAVGAVAEWNRAAPSGGHVAYVEAVTSAYIVTTSDSFDGGTDRQEIALNSPYMPDNFIHFSDYYGSIVQWSGDTKSQKTAWRVGADGRRHWIPSTAVYACLTRAGVRGPYALPSSVLDTVVPDDAGSDATCGADLNGDGTVNAKDQAILQREYGTPGHQADINLDGKVNVSDLSILASQWGKKPTPVAISQP